MKAALSCSPGGPAMLEVREVPDPQPGPGQVRIRVESCGLNFADLLLLKDLYQGRLERPFIPGSEISGVVDAVGEGVRRSCIGERVAAFCNFGGLAEWTCVPEERALPVPPLVSGPEAAALLTTYATSWHALVDRGAICDGERVLILGAAGGTGLAAVELASALGAHAFVAVSSEDKLKVALQAGATDGIVYPRQLEGIEGQKLSKQMKELVGGSGANIVYDPVGGPYTEPALRAVAWGGRYLVVGFAAGIPRIALNLPLLKGCSIVGVLMDEFARRDPQASRRNTDALFALMADGKLHPRFGGTFPLERVAEGLMLIEKRLAVGKILIRP